MGNGYAFCGGNPVNRRDPFGLDEVDDEMAAGNAAQQKGDYKTAAIHWRAASAIAAGQPDAYAVRDSSLLAMAARSGGGLVSLGKGAGKALAEPVVSRNSNGKEVDEA